MSTVTLSPVPGLPEIGAGDDLAGLIAHHLDEELRAYDVVVVTSKVVSKAAGLVTVAEREGLIDEAADRVVARKGPTRVVRTWHGLTLAAAGLDASNTKPGTVVGLPADPDAEAAALRRRLAALQPRAAGRIAVVITDTAGRAWRVGQTDMAIGVAGLRPLRSYAGTLDPYGNELRVTEPAVADEIASAAELAAGKVAGAPVVVVRGLEHTLFTAADGPGAAALIRDESEDLFGLGAHQAVSEAVRPGRERPRGFAHLEAEVADVLAIALDRDDERPLDVDVRDEPAGPVVVVTQAPDARPADAYIAFGALLERLRIIGRTYGLDVTHERSGDSAPLPARVTIGG
ncbi:MAG: coenzyme F420-0:L-glutamate ligase [Nocardioidaceae bacterium]